MLSRLYASTMGSSHIGGTGNHLATFIPSESCIFHFGRLATLMLKETLEPVSTTPCATSAWCLPAKSHALFQKQEKMKKGTFLEIHPRRAHNLLSLFAKLRRPTSSSAHERCHSLKSHLCDKTSKTKVSSKSDFVEMRNFPNSNRKRSESPKW